MITNIISMVGVLETNDVLKIHVSKFSTLTLYRFLY